MTTQMLIRLTVGMGMTLIVLALAARRVLFLFNLVRPESRLPGIPTTPAGASGPRSPRSSVSAGC